MKHLVFLLLLLANNPAGLCSQSGLLENVKKNPKEAISLCNELRGLNSKGISASSKEAIKTIAKNKNITYIDAEILSIYVIGLHCPEIN